MERRWLSACLGLEAFGRVSGDGERWFLPLDAEAAAIVRGRFESTGEGARRPFFEPAVGLLQSGIHCLERRRSGSRARYVFGGDLAALRRVLVIDSAAGLEGALEALDLSDLFHLADEEERERHARAFAEVRAAPARVARCWVDGPAWPPDPLTPSSPSDAVISLSREKALLGIEVWVSGPEGVLQILEEGLVPARWRFLSGDMLVGLSPERDLRSGGASFVFARLFADARLGAPIPDGIDYVLWLDPTLIDREDRFILAAERHGSFHALEDAVSDRTIRTALIEGTWPLHHEVLFTRPIDPSAIRGVQCRDESAKAKLSPGLHGARPPVWIGAARLPPEDAA